MEQEQQEIQEQQVTEAQKKQRKTFKDKAIEFFKSLLTDKIKCLCAITLLLQIVFIILQFVPVAFCTTSAKQIVLFNTVVDVEITNEKISVCSLLGKDGGTSAIFWTIFACIILSLKDTLGYFLRTGEARYNKLRTVKGSSIGCLILYVIASSSGQEMAEKYAEYGSIYQATAGGTWYVILAVAILVCAFVLSAWIKTQKEKERIEAKVQEELQKERNEQNEQKSI